MTNSALDGGLQADIMSYVGTMGTTERRTGREQARLEREDAMATCPPPRESLGPWAPPRHHREASLQAACGTGLAEAAYGYPGGGSRS